MKSLQKTKVALRAKINNVLRVTLCYRFHCSTCGSNTVLNKHMWGFWLRKCSRNIYIIFSNILVLLTGVACTIVYSPCGSSMLKYSHADVNSR